ncbi:DUF6333 family protein [Streptomyces inhibens]|uniref:DUF6333 family protein n=1 Tax=Streptomyces inhibens TaxID=2293571 RepID=UPI0036C1265C
MGLRRLHQLRLTEPGHRRRVLTPLAAGVLRYGEYSLTIFHPRIPGSSTDAADLPAHDPAVARRFAESFGTVGTILEELGTVPATADVTAGTRADLELVRVGCTSSPGMLSPNSPSNASPPPQPLRPRHLCEPSVGRLRFGQDACALRDRR